MDEHLNWKNHVDNISHKCSETLGVLNKSKHFLPINVKIILLSIQFLNIATFQLRNNGMGI